MRFFPPLSLRGSKNCFTRGLCWAGGRARIRLLIPADVCSASAVPALHLNKVGMMRKQISFGHCSGLPCPVLCIAVWHWLFDLCFLLSSLTSLQSTYVVLSSKYLHWDSLLLRSELTFDELVLSSLCLPVVSLSKTFGTMNNCFVPGTQGLALNYLWICGP